MKTCERCARPARVRGFCDTHYKAAQRAGLHRVRQPVAKAEGVKALAQAGENLRCVDCGNDPLFGGMRCLQCFQSRVKSRLLEAHKCKLHEPGSTCYTKCRCHCAACRAEVARLQKERRQRINEAA